MLLIAVPLGAVLAVGLCIAFLNPSLSYREMRISTHLADVSSAAADTGLQSGFSKNLLRILRGAFQSSGAESKKSKKMDFQQLSHAADFLELLQLVIAAGEGITQAIIRVSQLCSGSLGKDIRKCAQQLELGMPLQDALEALAGRAQVLESAVYQLLASSKRGTPVADVLVECANDLRAKLRESLVEAGGRKEISMMIPLVFGIMPLSVLFAVYPGITMLGNGF